MTEGPRTLDYFVLRCCERLGLSEEAFYAADRSEQVRWLAYDAVRRREEGGGGSGEG